MSYTYSMNIKIPYSELSFTFSRSSGAGGQNVNKVNSRVTMTWNIDESSAISDAIKKRFKKKFERFFIQDQVVIHSQKHRSQKMNIDDCVEKLYECLEEVKNPPKVRMKTKPTKASQVKRLESKSKKGMVKKMRREKF